MPLFSYCLQAFSFFSPRSQLSDGSSKILSNQTRLPRTAKLLGQGVLVLGIFAGCQEEAGASQAEKVVAKAVQVLGGQAQQESEAFLVRWTGPEKVNVGKEFLTKVALKAKAPFKVNQEYPIKIKLNEGAGLSNQGKATDKQSLQLKKNSATLGIKLKATKPGPVSLTGTLYFSVCTENRCLIEKQPLQFKVQSAAES